jgi:hypothetical protein
LVRSAPAIVEVDEVGAIVVDVILREIRRHHFPFALSFDGRRTFLRRRYPDNHFKHRYRRGRFISLQRLDASRRQTHRPGSDW